MSIQNLLLTIPGNLPVDPQLVFIGTNDSVAAVTVPGYLNAEQLANNSPFTDAERVLVGTRVSPDAQTDLSWMSVVINAPDVSLVASPAGAGIGIAGFPAIVSSPATVNFSSGVTADLGGVGATLQVNLPGLTASGQVLVQVASSSNPVTVTAVSVAADAYTVTLNADPGASVILDYIALLA